jgi:hypothetical protein
MTSNRFIYYNEVLYYRRHARTLYVSFISWVFILYWGKDTILNLSWQKDNPGSVTAPDAPDRFFFSL